MKVRVNVSTPQITLDKVFQGANTEEIVRAMQSEAATHVPFLLRKMVTGLPPIQFVREVVRRYNDTMVKQLPPPSSCDDFIQMGVSEGFVTIVEK